MAILHRKIFPGSHGDVNCNKFVPPLPVPPPPVVGRPPAETDDHESHSVPIFMFSVMGSVLLLLLGYVIYITKFHSRLNSSSARRNTPRFEDDYGYEIRGLTPEISAWQITTVGLQQSVIDSIPVFEFREADRLIEGAECSVCLNGFQEDETLRLLPKCSHAFHRPCIDTWLSSHQNCPLCRSPIVCENAPMNLAEPDSDGTPARQDLETESLESNGGTGGRRVGETEEGRKDMQCSSKRKRQVRVLSDLAARRAKPDKELQPVRRSISMDAGCASRTPLAVAPIPPAEFEGYSNLEQSV